MTKRKLTEEEIKYNEKGIERASKEIESADYDIDYNTLQLEKGIDVKCGRMKKECRCNLNVAKDNKENGEVIRKALQDQIDCGVEVKQEQEQEKETKEEE